MITYSDKEYQLTKLIKQGESKMNSDFEELADWIYKTYQAKPINIIYDFISGYKGKLTPRLEVVFEFLKEANKFSKKDYNFDEVKQDAISNRFKKILVSQGYTLKQNIWNFFRARKVSKYDTENLLVIFSSFEPIAKEDANNLIPESIIENLQTEINNPDLWKISRAFQSVTFLFYTDDQAKEYSTNGLKDFVAKKYFEILKQYDEFDYFKRDGFSVTFDSKENFDDNYQSNWYYYYK